MFKKNKADVDKQQQYQAEDDARTMQRHQEITSDPDRHQRAADHLGKQAQQAGDAHKAARKQLEKKTKSRLKKTFGGTGGKGQDFQQEKDKDTAEDTAIVNEKE